MIIVNDALNVRRGMLRTAKVLGFWCWKAGVVVGLPVVVWGWLGACSGRHLVGQGES